MRYERLWKCLTELQAHYRGEIHERVQYVNEQRDDCECNSHYNNYQSNYPQIVRPATINIRLVFHDAPYIICVKTIVMCHWKQ